MKDSVTSFELIAIEGVIDAPLSEVPIVMRRSGETPPFSTIEGSFDGLPARSIEVVEDDNDYKEILKSDGVEILALPSDKQRRRKILAKWAKKASKKNKAGLIPVMLLPLAACSPNEEEDASFNIAEDATSPGTWVVNPESAGSISITKAGGNYVFTPAIGDAINVAVAGVGEISLSSGAYSADAAALETASGTEVVTGAGNVALTKLEGDLDADLSVITTTGSKTVAVSDGQDITFSGNLGSGFTTTVGAGSKFTTTATIIDDQTISGDGTVVVSGDLTNDLGVDLSGVTATGGVTATETAGGTFTAGSDLGAATVTVNAAGKTVDLQAAGVGGVDASTFIVNAGTLVVTHAQMDAISTTGAITGSAGNVTVIAGSDTATGVGALLDDGNTQSSTALVKVEMSGTGTLTFDLPSDDNDTLVLEAGSVIKFGAGGGAGGTVVVDHGEVDARNVDAANWTNVGTVRVNSGINITAKQLEKVLTGVETSGSGRINVEIEEAADIALVKTLMTDTTGKFKGATKPAVTLEASSDATDATTLENQIIAEAPAIAKVAKIAIPVKTMAGGIKYSSPSLDIRESSDSGVSDADNVSQAVKPLMKIILPNANLALENDDTITVKVETLDGTTFTEVSSTAVVLNNTDGDVNKNVEVDANGNSYILFSGFDASQLDPAVTDGTFYITALADDKSDNTVNDLPSNKVMYVLDTTAPTAEIAIATPNLGAGQTSKVTVTFSEKVVGFDPAADITLSDSSAGSLSAFTSADGGQTWVAEFTPAAGLAAGSTTISLKNESYKDVAGNVGAGKVSSAIAIDTKAPDAPTVASVSTDNLLNKAEHDGGFNLTGTGEATATVKVSGFLTGVKAATVNGEGAWTLGVVKADLVADAATMLSITQSDAVGNKSDAVAIKLTTDVTVAAPTIDAIATDNKANSAEATAGFNITGKGEVGATLTLTLDSGKTLAGGNTTTVGTDGAWSIAVAAADVVAIGEGAETITAKQVDVAGNTSVNSATSTLTVDTQAPAAPTVTLGDGVSNGATDAEATATGGVIKVAGENGATIVATLTGQSGSVSKTITGTGSADAVVLTTAEVDTLGEGVVSASVLQTDAAGNAQTAAATSASFSIDTVVAAPTIDAIATDNTANAAEAAAGFNITGTGEVGATVTLTLDSGKTLVGGNTGTVGADGGWSIAVAAADVVAIGQGAESITAKQVDVAGNISANSTASTLNVDTAVPSAATVALGAGVNSVGATDAEATAPGGAVTVTGEDGAVIVATLTGQSGTVAKTVTGTGSADAVVLTSTDVDTLGEGSVTVSVAQTDAAGNAQTATAKTTSFKVDTIAPAAPVLALGNGVSDGATSAESVATGGVVKVTGEANASIAVVFTGQSGAVTKTVTGTGSEQAVALTSGNLTTLGEGAVSVSATQTDAAGNAQTASAATISFTLDTVVPSAPSVALGTGVSNGATDAEAAAAGGVVTVTGEKDASIVATFTTGSGETLKTVVKTVTGTGTADAIPLTSTEVDALGEGSVNVSVVQTDAAGNSQAAVPATITFVIDTISPAVPSFALATDTGSSNSDNTTSDATVNVTLAGDAAGWEYSLDAGTSWSTGSGTSFELADDTTYAVADIQVRQSDAAGNVSAIKSNSSQFKTVMPIAPPTFTLNADTGLSSSDNLTNDATVNVSVLAKASGWQYSLDGGANWNAGSGTSFELAANTTYDAGKIQVRQLATDGTPSSAASNGSQIETDTSPLSAPSAIALNLDSGTGSYASDGRTSDATVNVTLSSDAVGWEYSLNGGSNWTSGSGTSFELAGNTTYAADKIQARQLDAAGNTSSAAKVASQVITDMVGDAPVISNIGNSNTIDLDFLYALKTSGEDVLITGTAEANASVKVMLSTSLTHTTTANSSGNWSINASDFSASVNADNEITFGSGSSAIALVDNQTYNVAVEITDVAGNVSSAAGGSYTVDTPGIKITETGNKVTVSGTATEKLEVSVNSSGVATFARSNASGDNFTTTTSVSNFYDKQLTGVTQGTPSFTAIHDIEVTVDGGKFDDSQPLSPGTDPTAARYLVIDVPELSGATAQSKVGKVVIKGDLGTNSEPSFVLVRVADPTVYSKDQIDLLVDTSALSNKNDTKDIFELEFLQTARNDKGGAQDDGQGSANVGSDTVVFDYNTDVTGFSTNAVQNGSTTWYTYQMQNGQLVLVNGVPQKKYFADIAADTPAYSTVGVSLDQLKTDTGRVNFFDSGTLNINVLSTEVSALDTFLANPGELKFVGYDVNVQLESVSVVDGKVVTSYTPANLTGTNIAANIDAISFDAFVNTKAAIETLSANVKGSGWDAASFKNLTDVSAQLDIIKGAVGVSGSILNAIGVLPTYSSADNRFANSGETGAGSGLYQSVADMIDQSIIALEGGVSNSFDTLKEIETYITNLKTLIGDSDGALGTSETALTSRLDAIEASLANFIIDKTGPTVESVAITSAEGLSGATLDAGDTITITATFSEPVVVEGAPVLKIKIGDATKSADYASGAGTDKLTFTYTIASDEQNDAGGISILADAIDVSASGTKITDIAGNEATVTQVAVADNAGFKVALDTTTSITANAIATDNKISKVEHDGLTWFTGKGEPGADIKIEIGSGSSFSAASTELARVDEFGRWMVPYTSGDLPSDGTYEVRVTATDVAGNSAVATISSLLIDSVVPSTPTIAAITTPDNDSTPTITVTAENGSTVKVYANGDLLGTATNTSGTTHTLTPSALPDGNYSITAVATDPTGNASAEAVPQNIIIDVVKAGVPVISSASLTTDTTPTISGTAEVGSVVKVTLGSGSNTSTWNVTATDGTWSIDTSTTATSTTGSGHTIATNGTNAVSVTATDAAGNVSAAGTQTLTVDSTAPTVAITDDTGGTSAVNSDITFTFTFSEAISDFLAEDITVANGTKGAFSQTSSTVYTLIVTPDANSTSAVTVDVAKDKATDAAGNNNTAATQATQAVDTTAPVFSSNGLASAIAENSGAGQTIYNATADSDTGVTYTLKTSGDGSLFSINASTGAVTLTGDPNFEAKPEYDFTVVATDAAGNATDQDVTLVITNVDDAAPVFAAGATATGATIVENVSADAIVYNAYATDKADMSAGVTYTLGGTDGSKFNIDAQTGQVTTKAGQYDRETKATYEFTVTATDGASQTDVITVSGTVSDFDEVAATVSNVTSTAADASYVVGDVIDIVVTFSETVFVTGTPQLTLETGTTDRVVNYSSGDGTDKLYFQYTVQAGDTAADLDYKATGSLALNSGTIKDAAGNAATLTLATPNATNSISDNQAIVVDTTAPVFSTNGLASAIAENSGAGQTIYNATADSDSGVTYTLKTSGDGSLFSINASTGAVVLTGDPNFEAKPEYDFTVVATDAAGNATDQDV
ncbi:Ig-like domain-containing protein, partial [Rhodobacteraceae bacterium]|nr:Ig-like domain-containing protein [Paracoccaceae bacterium]